MSINSPIDSFIEKHGTLILDGGLATELEKMGFNLNIHLWSAQLLDSNPDAIRKVHLSYLKAGADCITTASYQASVSGFIKKGYSQKEARSLLERSVSLADEACDEFLTLSKHNKTRQEHPIVAVCIGPYGAYLANGVEYVGYYNVPESKLKSFHESRWEVLSGTSVHLFACETIPSFEEARVLLEILRQTPEIRAWMSFSCKDYECISDGTPIRECAALLNDCEQIVAIGANCTAPKYISSLIDQVRSGTPDKPVVVYPNSGKIYDVKKRIWLGESDPINFGIAACEWHKRGARLIGGCCQLGPEHIQAIRTALINEGLYRV